MAARSLARLLLAAELPTAARAFPGYAGSIPNGNAVVRNGQAWPGLGHELSGGGGARNAFGQAFADAGRQWTPALCALDSDGDGQSNGQELGDPDCVWTPGATPARTANISHPSYSDDPSASGASATTATAAAAAAVAFLAARLRGP